MRQGHWKRLKSIRVARSWDAVSLTGMPDRRDASSKLGVMRDAVPRKASAYSATAFFSIEPSPAAGFENRIDHNGLAAVFLQDTRDDIQVSPGSDHPDLDTLEGHVFGQHIVLA